MRKFLYHLSALILFAVSASFTAVASVPSYSLEGMIGGKYAVVIELEEFEDGLFSGRYAYKSTLQRSGDVACSWLMINPSYEDPVSRWSVRDCRPMPVEDWYNVKFDDRRHLTALMKNNQGKQYTVDAIVVSRQDKDSDLTLYFKEHIGDYPGEFGMFKNPTIEGHFQRLMGISDFGYLKDICQVEFPIEYHNGMYWGYGFKAHQCCDPVVLWAYDTMNESFYVWVRMNGRDYQWSETGEIPFKFRLLAENQL